MIQQLAHINQMQQQLQFQKQIIAQQRSQHGSGRDGDPNNLALNQFNQSISEHGAHLTATQKLR